MYTIELNNNISITLWDELYESSSTASWFQSHSCYSFYLTQSFLEPFAIAIVEDDKISALLCGHIISDGNFIKKQMSRRAIIPGGLMLAENCSDDKIGLLLSALTKHVSKKAIYTELRNYFDYSNLKIAFEIAGYNYKEHLNFRITTNSVDECSKHLSSTKRRDVKQSLKQGVEIVNTKNPYHVVEYYNLLKDLYANKIKTPLFPFSFFEKIVQKSDCQLFVIVYDNKIIGGSLCVCKAEDVLYEWFVCGLDGKFKNIFPSTLATWAAIEYAAINHYKYFDMMGAGKPDEGYGVRDFKAKFGGELVEHGRFLRINNRLLYMVGKKFISFIKKRK